jgi:hypothetical protein
VEAVTDWCFVPFVPGSRTVLVNRAALIKSESKSIRVKFKLFIACRMSLSSRAKMLSLKMPWQKPNAFKGDHTLTIFGPEFSGKTRIFDTIVQTKQSAPWISHSSGTTRYQARTFTLFDIAGDGRGYRQDGLDDFSVYIDPKNGMCLFVHDAAYGDIQASVDLLDLYVPEIIKLGGRFIMIILNKQDLMLPVGNRWTKTRKISNQFEICMSRYSSKVFWQIFQFDGFNASSDVCCELLLDEVLLIFRDAGNFQPGSNRQVMPPRIDPTVHKVVEPISTSNHLTSEAFWKELQDGNLALNTHLDRLRATYLTVLKAMQKNQNMIELVDEMQVLEKQRRSNDSARKHRQVS